MALLYGYGAPKYHLSRHGCDFRGGSLRRYGLWGLPPFLFRVASYSRKVRIVYSLRWPGWQTTCFWCEACGQPGLYFCPAIFCVPISISSLLSAAGFLSACRLSYFVKKQETTKGKVAPGTPVFLG